MNRRSDFILLMVILLALSSCNLKESAVDLEAPEVSSLPESAIPTSSSNASNTPDLATPSPTITPILTESVLISIDETWNRYTNYHYGITLLVPKTAYRLDAECKWVEGANGGSYRPVTAPVPVVVLEDGNRIIITSQYYSDLTLPTQVPAEKGYRHNFGGCELRMLDAELVRQSPNTSYSWDIRVFLVASLADLDEIIDDVYGECFQLGEMRPSENPDMLQAQVKGDGKPVEESACLLRGTYAFFYSPEHGKAATWKMGQSVYFLSDPTYSGHDSEMYRSFKFIPTDSSSSDANTITSKKVGLWESPG